MDHGKLAYIKVEELEARLDPLLRSASAENSCAYTVDPAFDLGEGDYRVGAVTGEAGVLIFAVLTLRAKSDVSAKVRLCLDGLTAGETTLTATAGEAKDAFVMCSAYLGGERELTVSVTGGDCVLLTCAVLVYGKDAGIVRTGGDAAVDGDGTNWALIESRGERVTLRLFAEPDFDGGKEVYIGSGPKADVCRIGENYLAVYVDPVGNLFAVKVSADGNAGDMRFVAAGCTAAAVCAYRGGAAVAFVVGGKLYTAYLDEQLGCGGAVEVATDGEAKSVAFVKAATPPRLVVTTPERSYLTFCADEHGGASSAELSAEIAYEAAN